MNYKTVFNSPVEIGTRITLILTAIGKKLSLDDLVMLDYALLYSKEFGGPENLHPALPNHTAEIAHRREFMPEAIQFFINRGLIDLVIEEYGHYYRSNNSTVDFVSCLQSLYYKKSWSRLSWIVENRTSITRTNIITLAIRAGS